MSTRETLLRYNFIINRLRRGPATFDEILNYLNAKAEDTDYNLSISQRTFQRDKQDILSLYGIIIEFDRSTKKYYIDIDDTTDEYQRLLEYFDFVNTFRFSENISKYVHLDKRPPLGTEYLLDLIDAMKEHKQITFEYKKFYDNSITLRHAEPYVLKEFKNRWYFVALDLADNRIKTFALDRLLNLQITDISFCEPKDFDANEYFKYCFGIVRPENAVVEEVKLSFTPQQGKYIKSLPLHATQKIIIDNDNEFVITLIIFITYDFIQEILQFGDEVKVLKPNSLVKTIKHIHRNALRRY
jgi:predicted DNA-binding transcriptional regulator YafY